MTTNPIPGFYTCCVCGKPAHPPVFNGQHCLCERCDQGTPTDPIEYLRSFETDHPNERQALTRAITGLMERDEFNQALARSEFDISYCTHCGQAVVCIPDGLPCCVPCGDAEERRNKA